ncbi:hypothetical protein ABZ070_01060 [Streptomyces sp. NPDC006283]|uniref:DUF7144 family membrane protein n=1 Tax=Streptomyces sp. NPDC006283 TaxID=3156741 RepID=UPI0033A9BEDF
MPRFPTAHDFSAGSASTAGRQVFAGVILQVDGLLNVFKGTAGIAGDDVYDRLGDYVFRFNLTAWGWILLVLGIVLLVTGGGVLRGVGWAQGAGVSLAALSILLNFAALPYAPLWAVISIAVDVSAIWALSTFRGSPTA